MLLTVVYASSAVTPFDGPALEALLASARRFNERVDVTGMLLYHDGNFLQAIEGPEAGIKAVMKRVAADPRHRGMIEMWRGTVEERTFAEWQMAFRQPRGRADDDMPEGFSRFLRGEEHVLADCSAALVMLRSFRNNLR